MAFKIKDLMINIAPSESGGDPENCVAGKKSDVGCVAGKKSDVGGSPDVEENFQFCPGRRTDIFCGPVITNIGGCPGKHTDMGCPESIPTWADAPGDIPTLSSAWGDTPISRFAWAGIPTLPAARRQCRGCTAGSAP